GVRGDQQREAFHLGRQRHRATHGRTGTARRIDDFLRRGVDQAMVEGIEPDADVLVGHGALPVENRYLRTFDTTPEPTVRPRSRIAKRSPSSIAIGAISSTVILMLSPGITISVLPGNSIIPDTSVVRKWNC